MSSSHLERLKELGLLDDCYVLSCESRIHSKSNSANEAVSLCGIDCDDENLKAQIYSDWKANPGDRRPPMDLLGRLFADQSISNDEFRRLAHIADDRYGLYSIDDPKTLLDNKERLDVLLKDRRATSLLTRVSLLEDLWTFLDDKDFRESLASLTPKFGADFAYGIVSKEPRYLDVVLNNYIDAFITHQPKELAAALQELDANLWRTADQASRSKSKLGRKESIKLWPTVYALQGIAKKRVPGFVPHQDVDDIVDSVAKARTNGSDEDKEEPIMSGNPADDDPAAQQADVLDILLDRTTVMGDGAQRDSAYRGIPLNVMAMLSRLISQYKGAVCIATVDFIYQRPFQWDAVSQRLSVSPQTTQNIRDCLTRSSARFVVGYISLQSKSGSGSHANGFIVDKRDNSVELFEPHGRSLRGSGEYRKAAFYEAFRAYFLKNFPQIKTIVTPDSALCPVLSFQKLQSAEDEGDHVGYCAAWTLWWIEFRLRNAGSTLDRADLTNQALQQLQAEVKQSGSSLTQFIRGYANQIVAERDRIVQSALQNMEKTRDGALVLQLLNERQQLKNLLRSGARDDGSIAQRIKQLDMQLKSQTPNVDLLRATLALQNRTERILGALGTDEQHRAAEAAAKETAEKLRAAQQSSKGALLGKKSAHDLFEEQVQNVLQRRAAFQYN